MEKIRPSTVLEKIRDIFPDFIETKPLTPEGLSLLLEQVLKYKDLRDVSRSKPPFQLAQPCLVKGTLVHGTELSLPKMQSIAEHGILASEFLGLKREDETNYCADFFVVPKNMSIREYVEWYHQRELSGRIKRPKQEQYYLPSLHNSQEGRVAIIINPDSIQDLLEMDAYKNPRLDTLITGLPVKRTDPKATRLAAISVGLPPIAISGLILPKPLAMNHSLLQQLYVIFGKRIPFFTLQGEQIPIEPTRRILVSTTPVAPN